MENLDFFINFAENCTVAFYIFDYNLDFLYVNPAFCKIFEYTKEEIIGKIKALDWVYEKDKKEVKKRIERRLKGESQIENYLVRFVSKSKKIKYCLASGQSTKINNKNCIIGTLIDITDKILYQEELQKSLQGVINTLSKIVEIKDPYTMGHQLRVSNLSVEIAKKLKLKEKEINDIKIAALLHDIGKITIPPEILALPRKLNPIERKIVECHPKIAYDILIKIPNFENIALIVLQHHERLDGSGYPSGLKDNEILLGARIIGVADVVEAMSNHRPYRPALKIEDVIEELYTNGGIKYDKRVVDICINLLTENKIKF